MKKVAIRIVDERVGLVEIMVTCGQMFFDCLASDMGGLVILVINSSNH